MGLPFGKKDRSLVCPGSLADQGPAPPTMHSIHSAILLTSHSVIPLLLKENYSAKVELIGPSNAY